MKSDFVVALTQLAAERNLPKEVILRTLEAALVPVFKKTSFAPDQEISVKILPQTGEVKVYAKKTVVRRTTDPRQEMTLAQARKVRPNAQVGDVLEVEGTPHDAGRIAAQTAKQVILQRLREAERDAIFSEYADKEGDVVSGVVHLIEPKQIIVDIGRAEAILPASEQVPTEHYRIGQRLKLYLVKVMRGTRGTQLMVSRTHQGLLRRLFELEVPEIYAGTVEIKALAREPGYRSKVAVAARQEGVDAVGCCLGLRSIRIQNIIKELNGEKIDVIQWHPDPAVFIASALSPASVVKVEASDEEKGASVIVPDKQLSLAIGRGGQNARLAARLTGWRIDIKSVSMAEAEKVAAEPGEVVEEVGAPQEVQPAEEVVAVGSEEEAPPVEAVSEVVETVPEVTAEPAAEEVLAVTEKPLEPVEASLEAPPQPDVMEEVEEERKTYSVEEVLSEIEAATEKIQRRFGGGVTAARSESRGRERRRGDSGLVDDLPPAKPKAKKMVKRPRQSDEISDIEDLEEEDMFAEPEVEVEEEDVPQEVAAVKSDGKAKKKKEAVSSGEGPRAPKKKPKKATRRWQSLDDDSGEDWSLETGDEE
ncbi:MAG: transcription termination/antitermination protein NusA [Chloroflexi bacterium]|nr:MAG: transcription termination/antitermination protein NusA [Chloroflexota bacterium]